MSPRHPEVTPEDVIQAHKVDFLVEQGVDKEKIQAASDSELDAVVQELFDREYWLDVQRLEPHEKTPGQKAEDLLIELINRHPDLHAEPVRVKAEHGSDIEDQEQGIDIKLWLPEEEKPVLIQMTAIAEPEKLSRKAVRLAKDVIMVVAPPVGRLLDAQQRRNQRDLQEYVTSFFREILKQMRASGVYHQMYEHFEDRMVRRT